MGLTSVLVVDLTIDQSSRNSSNEEIGFKLDPVAMVAPNTIDVNVGNKADLAAVTVEDDIPEVNINGLQNMKKSAINPPSINHDIIAYAKMETQEAVS